MKIRLILPQSVSYDTITVQVILKSTKHLKSYRALSIQNIVRVKFKQQSFSVLQEKLNLANVRNNSIFQPLMFRFWAAKDQGFLCKPFLDTRPLNFWLCSPTFDVCSRKAVHGASRKTAPTILSSLAKIVAQIS